MQSVSATQLPDELALPLRRFVQKRRGVAVFRALAIAVLIALLWFLAWGVVDRFVPLATSVRVGLLAILVSLIARVLWRSVGAMINPRIDWTRAARQYELHDNRFGQALVTVVSESLAPSGLRGSGQITAHLMTDVAARLRRGPVGPIVDSGPALRAWAVTAIAGLFVAGVAFWPWLDLPHLIVRQVAPFSRTAPVTQSQIAVRPGSAEVLYGAELPITARVQNPGSEGVILRTTTDGQNWNTTSMSAGPDGTYTRTLSALSRETRYEVRTGDAVGGPYAIRVLHHPVVRELSFRFEYPAYVDREPLTMVYGEQPIEAPAGTKVRVSVMASEPLRSAWFLLNDQRMPLHPADAPNVRQADFTILTDTQFSLEMVSERGVPGAGPPDVTIRAIQDRAPYAMLRVPPGISLMGPGSVHVLPYDAFDDYAIASLRARVDVDGATRGEIPLPLEGGPHQLEGSIRINLADWNVQPGQMVAVTLLASDRAGKESEPATSRVLISAQTVSPEQRQRIAELRTAVQLSGGVRSELESARLGLDAAQDSPATQRQATARLSLAAERATRLVNSLLIVSAGLTADSDRRLFESMIDSVQILAAQLDRLNAQSIVQSRAALRVAILELQRSSTELNQSIITLRQGYAAELILAERRALAGVADRRMPELDRLREEIDGEVQELGLEPRLPDLDQQLQGWVEASRGLSERHPPVDLLAMARDWARRSDPREAFLPERLNAAARVEASRANADPAWVRELQLAGRAARAVEAFIPPVSPAAQASPRDDFVVILGVLVQEHRSRVLGLPVGAIVDTERLRDARRLIRDWAGEAILVRSDSPTTLPLGRPPTTRSGGATTPPVSETRDQGMAVIGRSLELLTEMPQLLYELEQQARAVRAAGNRLEEARFDADAAEQADQPAAQRIIATEQENVGSNLERLADIGDSIDFTQPIAMVGQLRRYLPDTGPAIAAVESTFSPAMASLYEAIDKQDMDEVEQWIIESRRSIAIVQQSLRDSRATMLARDPTVIARTFAATTRPATQSALLLDAARNPWDDPLRRFINPQLLPQQSTLVNSTIATPGPSNPPAPPPRAWRTDDLSAILRDDDPPQYRDALNIYFQVLNSSNPQDR